MKKTILVTVAVLLLASLMLTACGQTSDTPTPTTEPGGLQDSIFDNPSSGASNPTVPSSEGSSIPTTTPTTPSGSVEPTTPTTPTTPELDISTMDYESYQALSGEDQQKFMDSFKNIEDFFGWYYAAKDEYEMNHPSIDVGDGEVDMEEVTG